MTDEKFDLSRRKLLGSLGAIGVASAGAGAGTFAYFSDTESSTGNTVSAGTLDLQTGGTAAFNAAATNLAPGDIAEYSIELSNAGTLSGDHVEIGVRVPSENDGDTTAPDGSGADVNKKKLAKNLHVAGLHYPEGDFFSAATQIPGAYVYDIDGDGTKAADIVSASDPASFGVGGVVHATSSGNSVHDYARSLVNVKGQGVSVNDLAGGTTKYQFYPTSQNTVSAPDEVKLVVEDGTGKHFLFQQVGPAGDDDQWNSRDVAAELNGNPTINGSSTSTANGWMEVDLATGSTTSIDPVVDYGSAQVHAIGFGAGNFGTSNSRVIDIYYGDLTVAGQDYDFRSRPMSLQDLRRNKMDNLVAPAPGGSAERFDVALQLNPNVGNAFQGDGVDIAFDFGLAQDPSQDLV